MPLMHDLYPEPIRFTDMNELVARMRALTDDPLASEGTAIVIFRGNPAARLMVIGEAPGAEEDRLGKPFVGKSGQLLDRILTAAGIDPERDVFVTNSVFRRPPNNRKPTADEIAWYRPYLTEIVRLIDPAVVVLAGGVAAESILGEKRGITKTHGHWYDWEGRRAMPIYHPAYLLRNPSKAPGSPKAQMWDDIRAVKRVLDGGTPS